MLGFMLANPNARWNHPEVSLLLQVSQVFDFELLLSVSVVFQKGGPGSLPGASVQGESAQRALRGGGEHPNHTSVFSERPRWDEGSHHEGKEQISSLTLTLTLFR